LDLKDPTLSPIDIALMELEEGVLPISIRRALQTVQVRTFLSNGYSTLRKRETQGKREES